MPCFICGNAASQHYLYELDQPNSHKLGAAPGHARIVTLQLCQPCHDNPDSQGDILELFGLGAEPEAVVDWAYGDDDGRRH